MADSDRKPLLSTEKHGISSRQELLRLLKENAVLRPGPGQPLRTVYGESSPWMFYSWDVTLTRRGMMLAAECLLAALDDYGPVQLATIGYTGFPLLMSCILLGNGRYTGLCVRQERKQHGACRRIDGPADHTLPVVLIDDSLVSGNSMSSAIEALESEGFKVAGGLCLVNFSWGGGMERLSALGYKVECVFDAFADLRIDEPLPPRMHIGLILDSWDIPAIEEGLHPALVARKAAERFIRDGKVAKPPKRFDRDYDGRGGVFVSFRQRDTNIRIGRDGFYHFDPDDAEAGRDVVLATISTLRNSPEISLEMLRTLKIAVSFLGPLEQTIPALLDFDRYGIVVRGKSGERLGGALPNTDFFIGEVEQYRHARCRNAEVGEFEQHDLYRYTVHKVVEPGAYWLPFGASFDSGKHWSADNTIGRRLVSRARQFLLEMEDGTPPVGPPVPENLIPAPIYTVGVTLFNGGVRGCSLIWGDTLDSCLRKAVEGAWRDDRFCSEAEDIAADDMAVAVSILHDQQWLGAVPVEEVSDRMRRGLDSVSVEYPGGGDMLLPSVCVYENLSKDETVAALFEKAGNPDPPLSWAIYPTATWIGQGSKTSRLKFGFPDRGEAPYSPESWSADCELLSSYIIEHLMDDGLPGYSFDPTTGTIVRDGAVTRLIHALWALDEAGRTLDRAAWRDEARRGLRFCLDQVGLDEEGNPTLIWPGQPSDPLSDSILLLALANAGGDLCADSRTEGLARGIRALVQPDGRIGAAQGARGLDSDHDIFPGVALLSLARYAQARGKTSPAQGLEATLRWYARRFNLLHPWTMAGWHPQAWNVLHSVTGDGNMASFALDICDWALSWQHERSGAFLCDLEPAGYSFHTGFIAEGMADGAMIAARLGDVGRFDRYIHSCSEALRFMNRLIIREEDTFCMPYPNLALGGVRNSICHSEVRIDYVSHTLLAFSKARGAFENRP